jgi:tetratricopeptide (TPR) repeat protein
MQRIEPTSISELMNFIEENWWDIKKGNYDIVIKEEWCSEVSERAISFLSEFCPSSEKLVFYENAHRVELAKDPNTPPEILARLANWPYHHLIGPAHLFVALNPNTPLETLTYLAKHPAETTRMAAAGNERATPEILEFLARDGAEAVRNMVTKNSNAPSRILSIISADKDPTDRARCCPHCKRDDIRFSGIHCEHCGQILPHGSKSSELFYSVFNISDLHKAIESFSTEVVDRPDVLERLRAPFDRALYLLQSAKDKCKQGDYEGAIGDSVAAFLAFPNLIKALRNIADCFYALGKDDDAMKYYKAVLLRDSQMKDIHFQLGMCYYGKGEDERAIREFETELKISGESSDLLMAFGSCYEGIGDDLYEAEKKREIVPGERASTQYFIMAREYYKKALSLDQSLVRNHAKMEHTRKRVSDIDTYLRSINALR